MTTEILRVGIDVGSITTKALALDEAGRVVHSRYARHGSKQVESVRDVLRELQDAFPDASFSVAISGSGSRPIAQHIQVPYIQEVIANSLAISDLHPDVRTAIELGGQDAKVIFFDADLDTGELHASDMRMNGSCAGGTGAFIDEVALVLNVPVERFDDLAQRGTTIYDISGRCGVYAKTDIQPLLNQGIAKEDLALSSFHAVAKQTIGGLAQGFDIHPPVIFEGGPLTFNPRLVRVFAERLDLSDDQVIIPEHPELMVARGAALFADSSDHPAIADLSDPIAALESFDPSLLGEKDGASRAPAFFSSEEERASFEERHPIAVPARPETHDGPLEVYLGIDSGSTTTKFALVTAEGTVVDAFYSSNEGEPLEIARTALIEMLRYYQDAGIDLRIMGAGSTGYGESMFHRAFDLDHHVVETVAHAYAAQTIDPDVSFILDIGGQDMKALWVDDGIITDIMVNEACSSGCGSFLENFATSLGIEVRDIAELAFTAEDPAALGSRCTVFMNSRIVSEQRDGKTPADIMAGLTRSIIENVFTKVIRLSNVDALGERIMAQGGTFKNDAVLRAFEQFVGKDVQRAPYPGLMGAIGIALLTRDHLAQKADGEPTRSLSEWIELLEDFSFTQETGNVCPFCTNHCSRTTLTFSDGGIFVTGNRCERGEVVGDPRDEAVRARVRDVQSRMDSVPDLFAERAALLFADYPHEKLAEPNGMRIGLPRVLNFWDDMPFWRTFFSSLGFEPVISRASTRRMYESGLHAVTSDTVCFPAKLVHGHIRDLVDSGVDRIFMPTITTMPSENMAGSSQWVCAVVKGYPIVMRNSDDPERTFGVPFDAPLFHWYSTADRERQMTAFMEETYGIDPVLTVRALEQADRAKASFTSQLLNRGAEVIAQAEESGGYAVVLASRPYQNDELVNHGLPELFTSRGIPVLTADSVPGATEVELDGSRIDIVNNYHARVLTTATLAAKHDALEFVRLVSFGCGHDAYLSDEVIRLMKETTGKVPLIVKVDESDIQGPLRIRVGSFVETVNMRRERNSSLAVRPLPDPYPVKYVKAHKREKVVLVPNTSHAFSRLMTTAFRSQGVRAEALPYGRGEAIRLGKLYVHNDICFPAQIVIGEALEALMSGKYDDADVAIGMGKYLGDCRLTHYSALLRKALDDAGFPHVPILTNDDKDEADLHPGFRMNTLTAARIAFGLPMIDMLEEILRKIRPYELESGASDRAFEEALELVVSGLEHGGIRGMKRGFERAIDVMNDVRYDRSEPRPTVLIVGEYLLNFHPGANHDIELYLEANGMEVIEARMTDVIRKTYFTVDEQNKQYRIKRPWGEKVFPALANWLFERAHDLTDRIATRHPLINPATRMPELVEASDPIIHHTFDAGEGVLIPGEILHHAAHGCNAFIVLQPFGCLPNHIVGRGIIKALKERYPQASILPLDYDPDVSFANIENRLQMLIMDAKRPRGERTRLTQA